MAGTLLLTPRRSMRRLLVVGQYGFFVAGIAVLFGGQAVLGDLATWMAAALFAACGLSVVALVSRYWFWSNAGECALDEREVALRNRAHLIAYSILCSIASIAAMYGMLAVDNGWWLPDTFATANAGLWATLLLSTTLPASVIAWLEPDIDPAETDVTPGTRQMRRRFFTRVGLLLVAGAIGGATLAFLLRS